MTSLEDDLEALGIPFERRRPIFVLGDRVEVTNERTHRSGQRGEVVELIDSIGDDPLVAVRFAPLPSRSVEAFRPYDLRRLDAVESLAELADQ